MSEFAKALRRNATEAERAVWAIVRASRLDGLKFKRQVPLGGYIVDFVCFEEKLILEIDGSQHADSARDARRDKSFSEAGYQTLRIWNHDAMNNPDGVAKAVLAAVRR